MRVAAAANASAGKPWRLSSLMLETITGATAGAARRMRRLQIAVAAADSGLAFRATHFVLFEDGQPVLNYRLAVRPSPPPMSVVFVCPRGGEAKEPPWLTAVLGCLAAKRPADLWAYLPWLPSAEDGGIAAEAPAGDELPFTGSHDAIGDALHRLSQRRDCGDMWQTLWRALRGESTVARGKRHVIVFAGERVRGVAGPGLVATIGAARGLVQVISSVPNPALESLCAKTRSAFVYAAEPQQVIARIEEAYLNLTARYEISYQALSQHPRELKVRIQCAAGWGEAMVAIPPPAN